ncbi:MAG: hypothetical protein ABW170_01440 [Candidatus Thiodiazotropha sp. L084R]
MYTLRQLSWFLLLFLAVAGTKAWSYGTGKSDQNPGGIAHTATVMETMSSAGYTYIRVEEKGKAFWIALPETQVSVGEEVSFYEQMLMENFTSKSLNRTFDRILFVEAINKGSKLPDKAIVIPSPNKKPPEQLTEKQKPKLSDIPVGRFTIKEIFEQKDDLVGKTIEVEGKISKLSSQIMGRDWVHVEDGTGTKQEKNNKIIFRTTQAGLAVGDDVVAKGILYLNKDFGYGYFYSLIVEDSVFVK